MYQPFQLVFSSQPSRTELHISLQCVLCFFRSIEIQFGYSRFADMSTFVSPEYPHHKARGRRLSGILRHAYTRIGRRLLSRIRSRRLRDTLQRRCRDVLDPDSSANTGARRSSISTSSPSVESATHPPLRISTVVAEAAGDYDLLTVRLKTWPDTNPRSRLEDAILPPRRESFKMRPVRNTTCHCIELQYFLALGGISETSTASNSNFGSSASGAKYAFVVFSQFLSSRSGKSGL